MNNREIPKEIFIAAIAIVVVIVGFIGFKVFTSGPGAGPSADKMKQEYSAHQGYSAQGPPTAGGNTGYKTSSMGSSYGGGQKAPSGQ